MTNQDVLTLHANLQLVKSLKGFNLAKAVVLNMKKINEELIEVLREMIKDKPKEEADAMIEEVLAKDSTITFITISDEDIPGDITAEQYAVLSNFVK